MTDEQGLIKAAKTAGRYVTFSFPHTGTVTHSVELRAPEFGDRFTTGRNQVLKRTRSGVTTAYDRGRDINTEYSWEFNNVSEYERAALIVFLEEVNWGASKIKITDWYGDDLIARMAITSLDQTNQRIQTLDGGKTEVLYSFRIQFIDITGNTEELAVQDNPNMTNALKLHVLNQTHPHNRLSILPNVPVGSDGIVDQVDIETAQTDEADGSTFYNKSAAFFLTVSKTDGTKRAMAIVYATTDRDYDTPTAATTIKGDTIEWFEDGTEVSSIITLTADVAAGVGGAQSIRVLAQSSEAGWRIQSRRVKV